MKSVLTNKAGKMLAAALILSSLSLAAGAQTGKKQNPKTKTTKEQAKPKDHVCTQSCHDSGKHVYAHGEKGHMCTATCKNNH